MEAAPYAQMLALLKYHYRDPHIHKRLPDLTLVRLFVEMQWVKNEEAKTQQHIIHGSAT